MSCIAAASHLKESSIPLTSTSFCPACMAATLVFADEDVLFIEATDGSTWCRLCKNWATQGHLDGQKHATELGKWHKHMRANTWKERWYHDMHVKVPSDGLSESARSSNSIVSKIMEKFAPFMQDNIKTALRTACAEGYQRGYVEGTNDALVDRRAKARASRIRGNRSLRSRSRTRPT